jgi:endogenous inhibitor of DNA gyrase (YacG/DUF329 family)
MIEDDDQALVKFAVSLSPEKIAELSEEQRRKIGEAIGRVSRAKKKAERSKDKKYIFQCEKCGVDFATNNKHKVYCSTRCKRKAEKDGPTRPERARKNCEYCNKDFPVVQPNQVFCSKMCRRLSNHVERECKRCGTKFKSHTAKYCSKECREEDAGRATLKTHDETILCLNCGASLEGLRERRKFCSVKCDREYRRVEGRYVYAWLDGDTIFYIGRGSGDRVTKHHGEHVCQSHRERIGQSFSYRIIRDGLTEEGSALVESVLIDVYKPIGNVQPGLLRMTKGPLTINSVRRGLQTE